MHPVAGPLPVSSNPRSASRRPGSLSPDTAAQIPACAEEQGVLRPIPCDLPGRNPSENGTDPSATPLRRAPIPPLNESGDGLTSTVLLDRTLRMPCLRGPCQLLPATSRRVPRTSHHRLDGPLSLGADVVATGVFPESTRLAERLGEKSRLLSHGSRGLGMRDHTPMGTRPRPKPGSTTPVRARLVVHSYSPGATVHLPQSLHRRERPATELTQV